MNPRLNNLDKLLTQQSLDATLISSPANIIYLTNFSHFSHTEREAFLLITKKNRYILTDGRYTDAVKKHITEMSYKNKFQLTEISSQNSFENLLKNIVEKEKILSLGIETNNITFSEHKKIAPYVKNIKHFDLTELRITKDKEEISAIQKACALGDKTFAFILEKIKPGITEKEVAFEMESFIRKNGAEISFNTIVAFGKNAAFPHHKTSNEQLKNNDVILLDFGVKYENYCSDMTRTIFFGKASPEQKHVYTTVLTAQQKAIEYLEKNIKNQIPLSCIDKIARDYIISQKFPSIPHSLGHGIGLEVHETPSLSSKSKEIVKNGMVFSIEPGIYLTDSIGVRIEDLIAIQDNKVIQLTHSPKNLIEL
jgi:Xaa-Pro aminopeptidase